jgi:hypothetical protein
VLNTGVKNMSQVVNQTQNSGQTFKIFTWGRFRYGDLEVIYPRKISLDKLTFREGENVLETELFAIRYKNYDSNRNLNREVEFIVVKQPIVIRYHGAMSASKYFDEVYLLRMDGGKVVVEKLEVKERTFNAEVGKYKITYLEKYVTFKDVEIRLETIEVSKEVIKSKLAVRVYREGSRIVVSGDTYYIKEQLKQLRFKWDPLKQVWYNEKADIAEVKAVLSNHINVEVMGE